MVVLGLRGKTMTEVIKREEAAAIFKHLENCRRHLQQGNIFSCLTCFREALRKMKATPMIPADEKQLRQIINEFQGQLAASRTFRDVYGPVTFRDNDLDTALDFMNQLIFIKEEEIKQSLEGCAPAEKEHRDFASLEEKIARIKMLISIGDHALAKELIGNDEEIISILIDFYNSEGIAARRGKDLERAILEFKRALVVYDQDEGIYYNLARVYMDRKEWQAAEEAILSGLGLNPDFQEGKALLDHIRRQINGG